MSAPLTYILFIVLTFLAEIIGTIGGFGSSVFFVPLAGLFFDFEMVLGITAVFHVASNLAKIVIFKENMDKKVLTQIGLPAVIFVILGAYLTAKINHTNFEIILGVFLILFSGYLLWFPHFKIEPTKRNAWIGGIISGFAAGLLGTGGAVRGLTMTAFNLEKNVFVATSAAIDMGVDLSRSAVYAFNGFIVKETLMMIPLLLVVSFAGSYVGKLLLGKISQIRFRKISLFLILGIGLASLIKFLTEIYYV